jgi:transketolase
MPLSSESPIDIDELCINTLRFLSVDAVEQAKSGHPGLPLGAAPMAYVLWTRFLMASPSNPQWLNRDRFILSAGHGSMLLYSLLFTCGFGLTLEDIKQFRQWDSRTPGHPEFGLTPGVEVTTGPLGQGFANGVGMAMAEASLAARFNRPGFEIINHFTYSLVSDGDLMEGVSAEAASLAGQLHLGKLIYLYDANQVSLSSATALTFNEDIRKRFEAYGWHVQNVGDGNDLEGVSRALVSAREAIRQPSLIIVRTHLGYGAPRKQDTFEAHGSPLGPEETIATKRNLRWPTDRPFYVPDQALEHFHKSMDRGRRAEENWNKLREDYRRAFPALSDELDRALRNEVPRDCMHDILRFPADEKGMATRVAAGKVINACAAAIPSLIGGSADLDPSTHTVIKNGGDFEPPESVPRDRQGSAGGPWDYTGRNIHFGVREHAMAGICSGLALHGGVLPYCATFLIFSDYMRPAIRLAAIMKLHVIYIFTHDSIGLGEDGTTHQPVEQLAGLRAIPHLTVIRPCDANETAVAWSLALTTRDRPVALILTRQSVPVLDRSQCAPAQELRKGAYILMDAPEGRCDMILIGTGSEVRLLVQAREELRNKNIEARIVSMPSWELFEEQSPEYRNSVLPPNIKVRLAVEAGATQGWHRYAGDQGDVVGIDTFGVSAPGPVVMREHGFTVENIVARALRLAGR